MREPSYTLIVIDMSVAGSRVIGVASNLLKVQNMEAGGVLNLDGSIRAKPGSRGLNDFLTLYINHEIEVPGGVERWEVEWDAQAGKKATILISNDADMKVGAPPARQLVTSSIGSTVTVAAVHVTAVATLAASANGSRQSLTVRNIGANDCRVGPAGVTFGVGMLLQSGGKETITVEKTTAAIYAICGAGLATDLDVMEEA